MRSIGMVRLRAARWALCATLLVACGGDEDGTQDSDSSADSDDTSVADLSDTTGSEVIDAADGDVAEVEPDVSEADVESDLSSEVAVDVAADVALDVVPDVAVDTTIDVAVDTAPEVIDPGPPPTVTINEYDCHAEWVEVVATGTESVDLGGLFLTDDVDDPGHRVPLTGSLAPGAFLAVDLDFGLACGSEGVFIVRGLDEVIAEAPAGDSPDLLTRGRLPDVTGDFALTEATRGAANKAAPFDPRDPGANLFDPFRPIATIDITLSQSSADLIWQDPYRYVPATFKWTEGDGSSTVLGDLNAAVRLKGKLGSYRDLNGKSAFKVDFDRFWPGSTFHGLKGITLNNMVQDWTRIHEVLAYDLFRKMGVPAPRATYAELRVNGAPYGLYLVLETLDGDWRDRNFDSTLGMLEGEYGEDFFPGTAYNFDLDGGSEAAYIAVDNLIQRIAAAPREGFMAALGDVIAWDEVLAMMATEVFIGHWDGYAPTRNNYHMHFDGAGVLRMVPWGTDQTFASDLGWYEGQGLLLQGCVNDPACRVAWEDKLAALATIVQTSGYLGWADGLAAHLQDHVSSEPREGGGDVASGLQQAWDFLARRAAGVQSIVACSRDPGADRDHDGHACDLDCDEDDPTRYVGATEICGDGIDQDCNNRPDDGPDCPDCSVGRFEGRSYSFCWRGRTYAEAATRCAQDGMRLAIINSRAENDYVQGQINLRGQGASWLGADDLSEEGTFRWSDGTKVVDGYQQWQDGEPNDYFGGEDCTEMYDSGTWNDLPCDYGLPSVCEAIP